MKGPHKSFLIISIAVSLLFSCARHERNAGPSLTPVLNGEPDEYSAVIIKTIEDSGGTRISESRIVKSGVMLREEWAEGGEKRAAIWRPDIEKSYLLSLDRKVFVETGTSVNPQDSGQSGFPAGIDTMLESADPSGHIDEQALPDETIDGHICAVMSSAAHYNGGRTETRKKYLAKDLSGLLIRSEEETRQGDDVVKVVTELKSIKNEVSKDEFSIPSDFSRVDRLD